MTVVAERAFFGCNSLLEVKLNEGIQKIGESSFGSCGSLQSITLPSTLTEIGSYAFNGCTNLSEVVTNEGLKKIGRWAFEDCSSLQTISLPSTITEIDKYAFSGCSSLREVLLNEKIQGISRKAFQNCISLQHNTLPSTLRFKFPSLSARLEAIVHCRAQIETKIDEVRGLIERNGVELFTTTAAMGVSSFTSTPTSNWDTLRTILDQIVSWIRYYEIKETTPLFELALWKENMNRSAATNIANREAYRIEVPGPVKEAILQYLFG